MQVKWSDGMHDFLHVDELEPLDNLDVQDPYALIERGAYGRAADLRRNLSYVHLSGRLANLFYSMGVTNTDFYAHQYRPLLNLLNSPLTSLLIADEVGLGKTIEAGLIWTELRARFDARRLLIVCPAMLREKWRDELALRFGIDAQIVGARELIGELKKPLSNHPDGRAWIASYNALRPSTAWSPGGKESDSRSSETWKLADLLHDRTDEDPLIDLVVFDEAHYMRNQESATSRAGDLLRGVSEYRVMLTATPINLRNRDLFNLLRLLDPDSFTSEQDFETLLQSNEPLIGARECILDRRSTAAQILEFLDLAARDSMLRGSRQLARLRRSGLIDSDLDRDGVRAELADAVERLNLLSHILTRTRKRDVQERRVRREVKRESVPMSDAERRAYLEVTRLTRQYATDRGINDGFLLSMPQRQIASCPAAVVAAWEGSAASRKELLEDAGTQGRDADADDAPLRRMLEIALPSHVSPDELRRDDRKYGRLIATLREHLRANPDEKVVIFTSFRATARYLTERLAEDGFPASVLLGGQARSKQEAIDEFRESASLRVMVSTEVAAEGVDLQFCRVLVNFDLPWNPMRIEQRIGRIDRLGQQSQIIHVWNLYFEDTIDERIVDRLLTRLRVFEAALGASEAVVGEEISKLEARLLSRSMTIEEEEAEIDRSLQALDNVRKQQEELEASSAHMIAHGQAVLDRIEASRELAQRVSEEDLYVYVKDYLEKYWTGHRFIQEGADRFRVRLQLPPELATRLDDFLRAEGLQAKTQLHAASERRCMFLNNVATPVPRGVETIHQFHPFIRFISRDLRARDEHFYPVVAIRVPSSALPEIAPGAYAFLVRHWSFIGVKDEELLGVAAVPLQTGTVVNEDVSERLLLACRVEGRDWLGVDAELDASELIDRVDLLEEDLERRFRATVERKREENADRADFQIQSIERHLQDRVARLDVVRQSHVAAGRHSLASATEGRVRQLTEKMQTRRERIASRKEVAAEKRLVCMGVVQLVE